MLPSFLQTQCGQTYLYQQKGGYAIFTPKEGKSSDYERVSLGEIVHQVEQAFEDDQFEPGTLRILAGRLEEIRDHFAAKKQKGRFTRLILKVKNAWTAILNEVCGRGFVSSEKRLNVLLASVHKKVEGLPTPSLPPVPPSPGPAPSTPSASGVSSSKSSEPDPAGSSAEIESWDPDDLPVFYKQYYEGLSDEDLGKDFLTKINLSAEEFLTNLPFEELDEEQLLMEALRFYRDCGPFSPVNLEHVDLSQGEGGVVETLLRDFSGICLGETHSHSVSKQFLIENMEKFQQAGVTTLFMEHFASHHQSDLDEYIAGLPMSERLRRAIQSLDAFWKLSYPNNIEGVVEKAKEQGIRIVGIDTNGAIGLKYRMARMNFIAGKIIFQEKKGGKFIALMGMNHIVNYEGYRPGVNDVVSCPGIAIKPDTLGTGPMIQRYHQTGEDEFVPLMIYR